MKILFVPYGTQKAPATRYRVTQYLPYLEKEGIGYFVFSAISQFSTSLMIKSPNFPSFIKFLYYLYVFLERVLRLCYIILISKGFDVVFLQRTTFPLKLEILLKAVNNNIVFDIDDAIYLSDKKGKDVLTRVKEYIKESEVVSILKASKAVIVENEYIKKFVSQYCKNVSKIPGPIDTERFSIRPENKKNTIIIGWIGSPATTPYLSMLDGVFRAVKEKHENVKFKFIGLGKYKNPGIEVERIAWDYNTEVSELQTFDIGIMPMPDDEWTRGKLGCKMLQYMAVGTVPLVSYTPTNTEIIKEGENGFLVKTESEWLDRLSLLVGDAPARDKMGKAGRRTVEEACSLRRNAPQLITIFKSLKKIEDETA